MMEEEYNPECDSLYTEEEAAHLMTLAQHIAGYECFLHLFEEGCTQFIEPSHDEYDNEDPEAVAATMACVAGTSLASGLEEAFTACFGDNTARYGQARRMERKEDRCYSFQEIMDWVTQEYSDDACVLQSIGWMDDEYNFDNATIMDDLNSLDPTVTDPIFNKHEDCVKTVLEMMEEEYNPECDSLYTEEEAAHLMTLAQHIAGYECFLHLFEEGCTEFIEPSHDEYDNEDTEAVAATMACVAGTSLASGLEEAFTACFGDNTARYGQARRMERKEDRCYSFQQIMDWVTQ